MNSWKQSQGAQLSTRIMHSFMLLKRQSERVNAIYAEQVQPKIDALREVAGADGTGLKKLIADLPNKPDRPLDVLFDAYQRIFPHLRLHVDSQSEALSCSKNGGQRYGLGDLSDGEKQVLCLLADVFSLANENSIIVVDEPELNLHPMLAEKLWDEIETKYDNAIFIYATHNISFSLRPNVGSVVVLTAQPSETISIASPLNLEDEDIAPFLGTAPPLVASDKCLIVEGRERSFDYHFYPWLLDIPTIEVLPVGGGNDVSYAAKRLGLWNRIPKRTRLVGVVDRDYCDSEQISKLEETCVVLRYHEAESYFCDPEVLHLLGDSIGIETTSVEDLTDQIGDFARSRIVETCAKSAFRQLRVVGSISLERGVVRQLQDKETLFKLLLARAQTERDSGAVILSEDNIRRVLERIFDTTERAIAERDTKTLLARFEGKELLNRLAKRIGCSSADRALRAAKKHLKVNDFKPLLDLKQKILGKLDGQATT